jgi:hypothetical protein
MIADPSDVAEFIKRLRVDLDELKNAQRVGYDSLLTYKTSTGDPYDISAALTAFEVKEYDITFTHDQAKQGALLVLNPYWRLNNAAVMASPVPKAVQTNLVSWMKIATNDDSTVWRLRIENDFSGANTYYVKLFFDGTDTGTFIVTAL